MLYHGFPGAPEPTSELESSNRSTQDRLPLDVLFRSQSSRYLIFNDNRQGGWYLIEQINPLGLTL